MKLRKCELCGTDVDHGVSAVLNGHYYQTICTVCKARSNQTSSGHARWKRSIDAEDHLADTVQPFKPDGSPNTEFAKLYPQQAKELFGDYDLRKADL